MVELVERSSQYIRKIKQMKRTGLNRSKKQNEEIIKRPQVFGYGCVVPYNFFCCFLISEQGRKLYNFEKCRFFPFQHNDARFYFFSNSNKEVFICLNRHHIFNDESNNSIHNILYQEIPVNDIQQLDCIFNKIKNSSSSFSSFIISWNYQLF